MRQQTGFADFNASSARKTRVFVIVQRVRLVTGTTMQTLIPPKRVLQPMDRARVWHVTRRAVR